MKWQANEAEACSQGHHVISLRRYAKPYAGAGTLVRITRIDAIGEGNRVEGRTCTELACIAHRSRIAHRHVLQCPMEITWFGRAGDVHTLRPDCVERVIMPEPNGTSVPVSGAYLGVLWVRGVTS